jgi:penicillin-binding protein 1B
VQELQQLPDNRSVPRPGFFYRREGSVTAAWVLGAATALVFFCGFHYISLARLIDRQLARGPFSQTVDIYYAPRVVAVGDELSAEQIAARLHRGGYGTTEGNLIGWYHLRSDAIEIFPGKDSRTGGEPAVLYFSKGKIARIISLDDNTERNAYQVGPQLIANLSDNHETRRLVHFGDLPPNLVDAVLSIEDKRFFAHSGLDVLRLVKAAYVDLKSRRKDQGASTLSMQLARSLWLEPDKRWTRKLEEIAMSLHLEEKLNKRQIFEDYANEVYLGRRGPFSINGFGEASRTYFGKDVSQLNTAEAALLAGMIQRPSYYNPYRYPERAVERRNLVLELMYRNGYLTEEQSRDAVQKPISLASEQAESLNTSYFLNMVNEELQTKLDDHDRSARYVYTTLDPDLQAAAEAAVQSGMELVDRELTRYTRGQKKDGRPQAKPQVALVALDPHTGEIRALVGGRDYAASQLNHALAMRQPGSVFKPFVYAAALNTAVSGGGQIFTPATVVNDTPTTFVYNGQTYSPGNFKQEFMGSVTLRDALAHSLNVATVQLAQLVGYQKIVALARLAGLNNGIQPTPAVALGAYETTPLEIAGAYTVFANGGMHVSPTGVALVRSRDGSILYDQQLNPRPVLDPRVNYLMVSMLQQVLQSGTGADVRTRGFRLPAAGKTGTAHDGWFAGFTSELLCVVWVGFDDDRELHLEGAKSALPIWTEFMKRAAKLRQYGDAKPFRAPSGLVSVPVCADSGQLAGPYCPRTRMETFIDGTQPVVECQMHSEGAQQPVAQGVVEPEDGNRGSADRLPTRGPGTQ